MLNPHFVAGEHGLFGSISPKTFGHFFFLYFRALCKSKEDMPEEEFVKLANTESSLNASLESLDHDDDAASEVKR